MSNISLTIVIKGERERVLEIYKTVDNNIEFYAHSTNDDDPYSETFSVDKEEFLNSLKKIID